MSKLFTILTACLILGGAGVAGYVYFTGSSLEQELTALRPSGTSGCSLCEEARKRTSSCCDGESLAKIEALTEKEGAGCCGESAGCQELALATLTGGAGFLNCTKAVAGGCCSDAPETPNSALSSLAGNAALAAK